MEPEAQSENVKVVVRCRPLSRTESSNGNADVVEVDERNSRVLVHTVSRQSLDTAFGNEATKKSFPYDATFAQKSTQKQLYDGVVSNIVDFVMQGYNGTVFAYGQTGTGKTYTMEGDLDDNNHWGVVPRSFEHIFASLAAAEEEQTLKSNVFRSLVSVQFVEIYQEDVMDLLVDAKSADARVPLSLSESPNGDIVVTGAKRFIVSSAEEMLTYLRIGKRHRATASTNMNEGSSRSHCIFTVVVETEAVLPENEAKKDLLPSSPAGPQSHIRVGKLNLVDLAGSERQAKTGATGQRFKESTKINLSLTCLGQVISALTTKGGSTHIPYRNSKLTRLLQDSLGGNSKTAMIANVGPAEYNLPETLNTLSFASRVKLIRNRPIVNQDPKNAMLLEAQDEIKSLKRMLELSELAEAGDENARKELEALTLSLFGTSMGPSQLNQNQDPEDEEVQVGVSADEIHRVQQEALSRLSALRSRHDQEKQRILAEEATAQGLTRTTESTISQEKQALENRRTNREKLIQELSNAESRLKVNQEMLLRGARDEALLAKRRAELQKHDTEVGVQRARLSEFGAEVETLRMRAGAASMTLAELKETANTLRSAYMNHKQFLDSLVNDFGRERSGLLAHIREMHRHVKFQDILIDYLVPSEHVDLTTSRMIDTEVTYYTSPTTSEKLSETTLTKLSEQNAEEMVGLQRQFKSFLASEVLKTPNKINIASYPHLGHESDWIHNPVQPCDTQLALELGLSQALDDFQQHFTELLDAQREYTTIRQTWTQSLGQEYRFKMYSADGRSSSAEEEVLIHQKVDKMLSTVTDFPPTATNTPVEEQFYPPILEMRPRAVHPKVPRPVTKFEMNQRLELTRRHGPTGDQNIHRSVHSTLSKQSPSQMSNSVDYRFSAFNVLPLTLDETGPQISSLERLRRFRKHPSILTQPFSQDRIENVSPLYTLGATTISTVVPDHNSLET